jgi:polar amino acid transport system substrate-binding protein
MKTWTSVVAMAWLIAGCATGPVMPTAEERQALAGTGELRLGFNTNPVHATKDPVTGEFKGPAIDVGRELAKRLGVPLRPVPYPAVPNLVASLSKGECDVLSIGINPERVRVMEFSAPYSVIESGYIVAKGVPVNSREDLDRAGLRIALLEKGDSDVLLSKTIKHAILIRTKTFAEAMALFKEGKADVAAFLKTSLYPVQDEMPGSRIIDSHLQAIDIAIAVPKSSEAAARYTRRFVEELKADGFVKASIERARVRGLTPAP